MCVYAYLAGSLSGVRVLECVGVCELSTPD